MALSVNISNRERELIMQNAQVAYFKTAVNNDPDPDMLTKITKEIYLDRLDKIDELYSEEQLKCLEYINASALGRYLNSLKLPDDFGVMYAASSGKSLISTTEYLADVDVDEINIPSKFKFKDNVLFPFKEYGQNILNISDSIKEKITAHNEKIEEALGDMDASLKGLLNTIKLCRTTKAFESKLPNLVTLYPGSVKRKIEVKNAVEEVELTEEQRLLQKASVVIATSKLMEE